MDAADGAVCLVQLSKHLLILLPGPTMTRAAAYQDM